MTDPRMSIKQNFICTENGYVEENNFASTQTAEQNTPSPADLIKQQNQYRQLTQARIQRSMGYERFFSTFPMDGWMADVIPPAMQVCSENQERNLQILESAQAMIQVQNTINSIHIEEEPGFFETLGDIAVGIVLLPFSIVGCSSEDPKSPPVYDDPSDYNKSNGESCSADGQCNSNNCNSDNECAPDTRPSPNYDAGSNQGSADAGYYAPDTYVPKPKPECTLTGYHYKGCYNGDVYLLDSCGVAGQKIEECASGMYCNNGACLISYEPGNNGPLDHCNTLNPYNGGCAEGEFCSADICRPDVSGGGLCILPCDSKNFNDPVCMKHDAMACDAPGYCAYFGGWFEDCK